MGKSNLKNIEIQYRIYKRAADHSDTSGRKSLSTGWTHISGQLQVHKLKGGSSTELKTNNIDIIKSKKTIYYQDIYLQTTGKKHSSKRDSLKGLAIRIVYNGVIVKKWYSDRTLESLTNW